MLNHHWPKLNRCFFSDSRQKSRFPEIQLHTGLFDVVLSSKKWKAAINIAAGMLVAGVDKDGNPVLTVLGNKFVLNLNPNT
jgi:hypothetical protein